MKDSFTAIIVDDERLARSRVAKLLEAHADVRVIGECRNGQEAIEAIDTRKPDLIFLDVQMPDIDGFGVIEAANLSYQPFVIFATAYDKYALRAFDVHAIDYLLKPFDQERFDASMTHARQAMRMQRNSEFNRKLLDLVRDYQQDSTEVDHIQVESRGRVTRIDAVDIEWIQSDGNYVTLFASGASHLHRATLTSMASMLDESRFLRIHRCRVVNIGFVRRVRYLNRNNEYEFTMRNGEKLTSGRSYKVRIREFLRDTRLLD